MQVHRNIDKLPDFRNAVITIGTFDGVHMGHRRIIDELKTEAKAISGETVIITFHPHPRKIIASPTPGIRLINTLDEKTELLENLGIDHLVVVPFTEAFSNQPAEEYIGNFLVAKFRPHTIIIGYDHRFGKERKGNYLLFEEKAPVFNYVLKEIPKHILDEIAISSTKIREALQDGKIETADKLLGYDFFFEGKVVDGEKLGRKLGYPTANLELADEEKIIPRDGIYAVYAALRSLTGKKSAGERDRSTVAMRGMMSIGFRPTVNGNKRAIEVNIFDFDQDIYGKTLRVYVRKYLRPQIKFDTLDALVKQIDQDKKDSLEVL
jgi:riboflavin kinase/FMN adenylyltransferase